MHTPAHLVTSNDTPPVACDEFLPARWTELGRGCLTGCRAGVFGEALECFLAGAVEGFLPGVCTGLAVVLLAGCAPAEAWARNHEREYRLEYREGGGSASVTVRPWNPDLPRPEGYRK